MLAEQLPADDGEAFQVADRFTGDRAHTSCEVEMFTQNTSFFSRPGRDTLRETTTLRIPHSAAVPVRTVARVICRSWTAKIIRLASKSEICILAGFELACAGPRWTPHWGHRAARRPSPEA